MGRAIFFAGTLALVTAVAVATFQSARLLRRHRLPFNPLLSRADNALRLGLILACVALGLTSGLPFAMLGWESRDPAGDLMAGLGIGLALTAGLNGLSALVIRHFGPGAYSEAIIRAIAPRSNRELGQVLLALLPAALLEELVYRSLLVGGFSPYVAPWLLALLASALFGAMHTPQGILGGVATALAGLALSALFLWRDGLLAPWVAHYLFNAVQVTLAGRKIRASTAAQTACFWDRGRPPPGSASR